ncbi:ankyrin repeat domain-containing protein [Planoprotostelium fungivorum]|uniref:Ankyrin repeat domain-containing protein n=1 Tax=Planoprotostelium fungivorum TaxID=1890364 RepID=A0A2P6NBK1_9EUKA|nr:ankyrin repeat domain-containing protein [Planoprotostelium fungivorum]
MDGMFAGYEFVNGIAGGYDITRCILRMAFRREEDVVEWKYQRIKRKQFCCLRSVCRSWKELMDSFVDLFDYGDLVEAMRRRSPHSVRLLLHLTDIRQQNPLCDAFELKVVSKPEGVDLVRALLTDPRVNPAGEHNRAMREASSAGLIEVVGILLEDDRVDPTESLMQIVEAGHTETVKFMLARPRVDPSAENNKAIQIASRGRSVEIVRLLANDARVDPSASENYAVIRAARNGDIDVVELLSKDCRVNLSGLGFSSLEQKGPTFFRSRPTWSGFKKQGLTHSEK